jgi:Fe-S cluster assembly scaffold protein SufB
VRISQAVETDTISLEKIIYLQSKGFSEEVARSIVISGFRDQVLSLVSEDSLRQEIREMYTI